MTVWKIAIKGFRGYLRLEKSLSENSVEAYANDVTKLAQFCEYTGNNKAPKDIKLRDLQKFLRWAAELGMSARSQSRIISGIRSFYTYQLIENEIKVDPTELLELPKIGRKLPVTLSHEEIVDLIAAIDKSTLEGERNRTMLETLYSCGLRVSELVGLRISDLYLDEGFVRVVGKGDKERLTPIGSTAVKYIKLYLHETRPQVPVQPEAEDVLFLNRRGRQLTRVMIFTIIRQLAEKINLGKTISPHTFRHSFATELSLIHI